MSFYEGAFHIPEVDLSLFPLLFWQAQGPWWLEV